MASVPVLRMFLSVLTTMLTIQMWSRGQLLVSLIDRSVSEPTDITRYHSQSRAYKLCLCFSNLCLFTISLLSHFIRIIIPLFHSNKSFCSVQQSSHVHEVCLEKLCCFSDIATHSPPQNILN